MSSIISIDDENITSISKSINEYTKSKYPKSQFLIHKVSLHLSGLAGKLKLYVTGVEIDCEMSHLSVIQAEACAGSNICSIAHGSSVESESEGLLGS